MPIVETVEPLAGHGPSRLPTPEGSDPAAVRMAGMVALAGMGATQRFIGRVYGVSAATVCRTLRRARKGRQ